jgi:hypothetical protein
MLHIDRRTAWQGDDRSEYHEAREGPAFRDFNGASVRFSHDVLHCRTGQSPVATGRVSPESTMNLLAGRWQDGWASLKISIATATARGVYRGRKSVIDTAEAKRLSEEEKLGSAAIARRLSIGRASVYRHLGRPWQIPAVTA